MRKCYDVAIIGAGIVGMATGMKLVKTQPQLRVAVLDKEAQPASHQTGHNSGVIHSGIYYRPGSLKALMCISGSGQLVEFCKTQGVPFELCGKVVIATRREETARLHELFRRGTANGVQGLRLLTPAETKEIEPHASCLEGMYVPTTGIVDFRAVTRAYANVFQTGGGTLLLNHRVEGITHKAEAVYLETSRGEISARFIINCGGLYSDRLARMAGAQPPCRIIPFRGEYYQIREERRGLVRNLIYPVPDPRFPFLGVHFTRMIDGKVEAGPNAVLALAREGYSKSDISWPELAETLQYPGFWRVVLKYGKYGSGELMRSFSRRLFTRALKRLVPDVEAEDLTPAGAGVRAQAVGRDGALLDDFVILRKDRMVHVLNAPSPAATSSLAIADHILGIFTASLPI